MASPRSVLVLGAGELGLAMIEALCAHPDRKGTKIAALLRQATLDSAAPVKRKTVQRLKALHVDVEGGDVILASVDELALLFSKYEVIVSCNGMGLPSGMQKKLCEAVFKAKVNRYFPWQFGMDYDIIGEGSSQDLFDEQLEVRKMLRGQEEVKWTIVSTGLFMSFLFLAAFGTVDLGQKKVRGLGSWDNTITLTTPEDIGRVTADVILAPGTLGEDSGVVYTAGDTLSYEQVGDIVDGHFGRKFERELWDKETLKKQLAETPDDTMIKYRDTFAQGRGVAWEMNKTVNHQRGIGMTDVKEYLKGITADQEA
ncbi:hypothetical protein N3K66_001779 [Trichothecium roseum]|uniref:Uncharacterized protein n=1 Tax=Trichothecium roseum TaxID=47278 RepID=A0ACC0V7P8_9HYPO|nr:hypothetical protein N3K66_001779 [Trichothecium roseum]